MVAVPLNAPRSRMARIPLPLAPALCAGARRLAGVELDTRTPVPHPRKINRYRRKYSTDKLRNICSL